MEETPSNLLESEAEHLTLTAQAVQRKARSDPNCLNAAMMQKLAQPNATPAFTKLVSICYRTIG